MGGDILTNEIHRVFMGVTVLMNMPARYAQTAFTLSIPVMGLLWLRIEWRALKADALAFAAFCRLLPGMLFGGGALNALGHLIHRTYHALHRCLSESPVLLTGDPSAWLSCRIGQVFPLFPGNGGLLIHFAVNALLLWWWRRSVHLEQERSFACR